MFEAICEAMGLPRPVPEYRFDPNRRWRFDFAWPERKIKIAVEVEGGIWTGGRHIRGRGFEQDLMKYNEAVRQGWQVYRFTTEQVENGYCFEFLKEVLSKRL